MIKAPANLLSTEKKVAFATEKRGILPRQKKSIAVEEVVKTRSKKSADLYRGGENTE